MLCLQEGNVKMVVGFGRREDEGSCCPGKGSKDLKDFLSCSGKSLGVSTVLFWGSVCALEIVFIFKFVFQVPKKTATFLQPPAAVSLTCPEMPFLQLQYHFPDSQ